MTTKVYSVAYQQGKDTYVSCVRYDAISSIEEIELNGLYSMLPYIRIHYTNGEYTDVPKHNTISVHYYQEK